MAQPQDGMTRSFPGVGFFERSMMQTMRFMGFAAMLCGSAWGCQSAAASDLDALTAGTSSAAPKPSKYRWYVTGSDPRTGEITVRCENATPPEDGSGQCKCEGTVLDPCVTRTEPVSIDRKKCGFRCAAIAGKPAEFALACPGGGKPRAASDGCWCDGSVKPMNPCKGGKLTGARAQGDQCLVTCDSAAKP